MLRDMQRTSLEEAKMCGIKNFNSFKVLHVSQNSRVCACKTERGREVIIKAYTLADLSDLEIKQVREIGSGLSCHTSHRAQRWLHDFSK